VTISIFIWRHTTITQSWFINARWRIMAFELEARLHEWTTAVRTLTRSCWHRHVVYIPLHFHPKFTNRIHSNAHALQGSNWNTSAWLELLMNIVDESKRLLIILKREQLTQTTCWIITSLLNW
jgi:hypothetical protein